VLELLVVVVHVTQIKCPLLQTKHFVVLDHWHTKKSTPRTVYSIDPLKPSLHWSFFIRNHSRLRTPSRILGNTRAYGPLVTLSQYGAVCYGVRECVHT